MDFLVNKMGWKPSAVVQIPTVLNLNLEKWFIPRCSIIRVLVLKGLINKEIPLSTVLVNCDERFLDTSVTKYQDEAPQFSLPRMLGLIIGHEIFEMVALEQLEELQELPLLQTVSGSLFVA
ncbi:hypothetical protein EZV62_023888 [Acer yangbiense]|uniref:Uncharacterized protein n=1 Tax=Acer yangbiense TaxID=1000413 RepID=A0A5C7H2V1_9ROSI|nr:hypothetical protein EZV62_023888 [Acer yangbiense]